MRVHSLRITAFGPFTDTVEVDGDALGADGLFLLTGATGAGKSSVLDAICFALYGAVPGRRQQARALRSDLASPEVAPEVVLEVSLGGVRYRFTRSPAWERPKRRGTGTTTQQASVSVQRLGDDGWVPVTHRLDEAGDLVGRLLGMTCPQFCQVAMLPQGEFQTFLQARSDDRRQVLQQLFRTGRYHRVEGWLVERRRATRRTADARSADVTVAVHRAAEAGAVDPPDTDHLVGAELEADLDAWSRTLASDADAEQEAADTSAAAADLALRTAREHRECVESLVVARRTYAAAVARAADLDAAEPERTVARARLAAARRAEAVAGLADEATRARGELRRAEAELDEARTATGQQEPTEGAPARLAATARRLDRLRDARPVEADLHRERAVEAAARRAHEADADALAAVEAEAADLPAAIDRWRADAEEQATEAAGLAAATEALGRARRGLDASRRAEALAADLESARLEEQDARERRNARHEALLALRDARIDGMAAELAGSLAVGQDCPVCGSCDHPSPARPVTGAVDGATEREARRALDTAELDLTAHRDHLRGLELTGAAARTEADDRDPDSWAAEVHQAATARDDAARAAVGLTATRTRLADAEAALAQHDTTRATLSGRLAAAEAEAASAAARAERSASRLAELLDGAPDLATALSEVEAAHAALSRLVVADERHDRATEACRRADTAAADAARRQGFDGLADAVAAGLTGADAASLEAAEQAHRDARRDVDAVLADPELRGAAEAPTPDVAAAAAGFDHAEREMASAARRRTLATTRRQRLVTVLADLRTALDALVPAQQEADRARALADLATGQTAGVSLPAYVLAWRLGQVVDAANVRLGRMTDGRFVLEHHVDGSARGTRRALPGRGGLDLLVRDEWSGTSRPPTTLSGGETFVVSLALALGLADVVTQEASAEASGVDIETLFVDEGFGSLDADTLDDVLGVLDELREGGRVVGVVSHVADMRERIGTRLEVLKGDRGSRVRLVRE